jgi:1,4-dihydroxy-2-naphthoate octaprenyltransferase
VKVLRFLAGISKAPFLLLAPACVLVGVATAFHQTGSLNGWYVGLVLLGGLAAHITVNVFNEYFDFKSKLDEVTQRTPFSGGSGALQAQPSWATAALIFGCFALFITACVGLFFIWKQGWGIMLVGLLGLFLTVTYTIWWLKNPLLSLIAPGLGFGILMVLGTHFALTGSYSWTALVASLVPTFLVGDLLLLNQFPDAEADQTVGRKHYPLLIGRKLSSKLVGVFYLLAFAVILAGVLFKWLPVWCLLALLPVMLAWRAYRGASQHADNIPELLPSLGLNGMINLITPVLLAIGLFLG